MPEFIVFEPVFKVTEGILIRDKVDKSFFAVALNFFYILICQAIKPFGILGECAVFEAFALHIELKLIIFKPREIINHSLDF